MTKIGPFPIVTESTITEPGWYWFEPAYPQAGGNPKFVQVEKYAIDGGWLKVRIYAGKYAGPFEPPDMSCQHKGIFIRTEQFYHVYRCDECGVEFKVND
jgi:hypothetical protein